MTLSWTDGQKDQQVESSRAARQIVRARYPRAVFYDAGGFRAAAGAEDVRSGRVWLAWPDESASIDDDGSGACAELLEAEADEEEG